MKHFTKKLCLLLSLALLLPMCGCRADIPADPMTSAQSGATAKPTSDMQAVNLMASVQAKDAEKRTSDATFSQAAANFAVGLLQGSADGTDNCVLSPYSAMIALAMTANGAQGETLAQMESVLGLPIGTLNEYLHGCDMGSEVVSANAMWFRDTPDLIVKDAFLQANADYYGADAYSSPFDAQTVKEINDWVSAHTDGRIPSMLDDMSPEIVLVLINALTFDAQWQEKYAEDNATDGEFNAADGTVQPASYLHSEESTYLDDGMATGFLKPYAGGRYSYLALLPNEDVTMEEYLASLTGEKLLETIANASSESVKVAMPKLKTETTRELNEPLCDMGMPLAFGGGADFSGIADKELCIDTVLQKTYLEVDENGTKAAAATAVIMKECAIEMTKSVFLNRPFVMGIYDNETQTFLFLGVINQVTE
ncbi:MAG: serpin family protein [Faecousia sp.]